MNPPIIQDENIYFINVAKTLAIFLMVLAHLAIPNQQQSFINSFHMPLFFIITGYLISVDTKSFKFFLIKKLRTLLLPYAVFAIVSFIFWYFIGRNYGDDALIEKNPTDYLWGILLAIPTKEYLGFNFPIWYLPSFFCAEILFYWIKRIFKKYSLVIILLFVGLGIFLNEIDFVRLPFAIDVSFFTILFFQIGQWLKKKNWMDRYICSPSGWVKMSLFIVFLCLTIYISLINVDSNNHEGV
jgi:fucose 4-O-acetylase-like acetyltransferase